MKYNMGQSIITCKNCGSNRVTVTSPKKKAVDRAGIGGGLIMGGTIIPIIGWFTLLPLGILIIIYSIFNLFIQKNVDVKCEACKHKFIVSKERYNKYIKTIN